MKRYWVIGILILSMLFLVGCATRHTPYPKDDLINEPWQQYVDANPNKWAKGADRWFFTGEPNRSEQINIHAPNSAAISTTTVRVPDFTNVKVSGAFQVQLYGSCDHNSVSVFGPNNGVRQVAVEVHNGTLYLYQAQNAPREVGQVIVRVGVRNLRNLIQNGQGRIEGRQLQSNGLCITSNGSGNVYLAGDMNVWRIISTNCGSVNVFGAISSALDIRTSGSGCVNVSGQVGLRSIYHRGSGNVNIIGACGQNVKIYADGRGKVGLNGHLGLREVIAKDKTCVYACFVNSHNLYAYAYGNAHIGLAGCVNDLYVETAGSSRFGGRALCVQNAYVRARDWSHINVTATNRVFASATQNSSVYFFGTPNLMSQFVSGNGMVMPIWTDHPSACYCGVRRYSLKGEIGLQGEG